LGPHWLVRWMGLRQWLHQNRFIRPPERHARIDWREAVRWVWRTREAFLSGDLVAVISAHGAAVQHIWAASAEFRRLRGQAVRARASPAAKASWVPSSASQPKKRKRAPVDKDAVRARAAKERKKGRAGYLLRTGTAFNITAGRVGQILSSKR